MGKDVKIEEHYSFESINEKIIESNSIIERNIELLCNDDRGLLSQNLLSHLRTFIEYISFKLFLENAPSDKKFLYDNLTLKDAMSMLKSNVHLKYVERFHYYLQISKSHYVEDDDGAERLMLKYYRFLLMLKNDIKKKYGIPILDNLSKFPLNCDSTFNVYYASIAKKLENTKVIDKRLESDKYYVQKVKPFFSDEEIYYEVTLTLASNHSSKFDRIIAFTKLELKDNYAIKVSMIDTIISIFGRETKIKLITNWQASFRACEVTNFARIFGLFKSNYTPGKEYAGVMDLLTRNNWTLLELVESDDYLKIRNDITSELSNTLIFETLDMARNIIKNDFPGANLIKYLLFNFNNYIIKQQYCEKACNLLSNLHLKIGCLPFEQMPFATSLIEHNPKLSDLLEIFDPRNRNHELLARKLKYNSEVNNMLYTSKDDLIMFENIEKLVEVFNSNLYSKHIARRKIIIENDYLYINGYELDTIKILNQIKELTTDGVIGYTNSFKSYLENDNGYIIDDSEKRKILLEMYENSFVSLIYGAAGTGKTTLIKHLTNFFSNNSKLCLANTNSAVENLRRNITVGNSTHKTIYNFLHDSRDNDEYDILIIDECSTVSNKDMVKILDKCKFKLLLLVGDIYQIESISFGNWFSLARNILPNHSIHELNFTWRSTDNELKKFWDFVRNDDDRVEEMISKMHYASKLDDSIFSRVDGEMILCLNYDGLYGINSINSYLQNNNSKRGITLNLNTYKIDDPILFNDTSRFLPVIYNNMSGKIVDITEDNVDVWFDVEIRKPLNEFEVSEIKDLILVSTKEDSSIVRFNVRKHPNLDDDDDAQIQSCLVPFSVSYAISMHKAQGLEFDYVKVLLTNEVGELITHNIFYTAITRAKINLKIFWPPESQNKILSKIHHKDNRRDVKIIRSKLK